MKEVFSLNGTKIKSTAFQLFRILHSQSYNEDILMDIKLMLKKTSIAYLLKVRFLSDHKMTDKIQTTMFILLRSIKYFLYPIFLLINTGKITIKR